MRAAMRSPLLLVALAGCDLPDLYSADGERECEPRTLFYEDLDEDGVGNERSVYVGCAAPAGYVKLGGDCNDVDAELTSDCGSGDSGA